MPRGVPFCLRCPKCRQPWPERIGVEDKMSRSKHSGFGRGGRTFYGHRGIVRCKGCKHTWASTHPHSGRIEWQPHVDAKPHAD